MEAAERWVRDEKRSIAFMIVPDSTLRVPNRQALPTTMTLWTKKRRFRDMQLGMKIKHRD